MKNFGKWALCLLVCLLAMGFVAQSALADGVGGGEPPNKGGPAEPPHESVGPTYYGQPMMLDGDPWDPFNHPKGDSPKERPFNAVGPASWWMQPALDDSPWADDPPRKNSPKE